MEKKVTNFRLSERSRNWLRDKSRNENRSQSQIVEELIRLDEQKKNGYVDELAKAISRELASKWDGMYLAVNQNNKILKVQQEILNYQMLAQELRMNWDKWDNDGVRYRHFAFDPAEKIVNDEIKALQVAKAEAKRKKENRTTDSIT